MKRKPAARAPPARTAKLSRPSAHGLTRRDRLFRSLDAATRFRVVWVSAPAGSGKTSLVTTWLETRGLAANWYRLDNGDADLGSLFQTLRLSTPAPAGVEPLPAYAPAHQSQLDAFARRFFCAWCERFDQATTLVFDNYEQTGNDSRVGEVLAALLDVLPSHLRVLVLSRGSPPAVWARWEASPELLLIGWDDLRFSDDEARALAASWGVADSTRIALMVAAARGWAAGMVLMLRAARAGITLDEAGDGAGSRGVFNYFASEIFDRVPAATQEFLLRTAFLPDITVALAQILTGEARAARILAELHADNFFIERKHVAGDGAGAAPPCYELHPLFRDFLHQRARECLGASALEELRRRAASALEAVGQVDAAAQLLIDAGDATRLVALIEQQASSLARSGRFATLRRWIESLPAARAAVTPRLQMWLGVCKLAMHDDDAETAMTLARDACETTGDVLGSFAAGSLLAMVARDAETSGRHFDALRALVDAHWDTLTVPQQVEALEYFRTDTRSASIAPLMRDLRRRVEPLLERLLDPESKLWCWAFLGSCAVVLDFDQLRAIELRLRPLLAAGHGSMMVRARNLANFAHWRTACGTAAEIRSLLQELLALGDVDGLFIDQANVWALSLRMAVQCRAHDVVQVLERRLRPVTRSAPYRHFFFLTSIVRLHLEAGRHAEAQRDLRELEAMRQGAGPVLRALLDALEAQAMLCGGDLDEAEARIVASLEAAREAGWDSTRFAALLLEAVLRQRLNDREGACASLRSAFEITRSRGIVRGMHIVDALMAEALVIALRERVDPETALHIIEANELPPPPDDVEAWPRAARLRVLGTVSLEVAGAPAHAPKRPLELLLFLAAHGGGPVAATAVMDALWPDAEGDAAKKSLDITLHRLRRLLGAATMVTQDGGRLLLDTRQCWVDAIAFVHAAERAAGPRAGPPEAALALALYRGHFLGDDCHASWAMPYRERLRSRYLRLVEHATQQFIEAGDAPSAQRCLARAVELDPTFETLRGRLVQSATRRATVAAPGR